MRNCLYFIGGKFDMTNLVVTPLTYLIPINFVCYNAVFISGHHSSPPGLQVGMTAP